MSPASFSHLPPWAMAVSFASHAAAGMGLGAVYFRVLRWNADLLAEGRRTGTALVLMLGRFIVLGGILTLASLEGALPLLAMALGVLIARSVVLHRLRDVGP